MKTSKSNRWLMLAAPIVGGLFICSQPAHAQYVNPNSVYGSIAQQAMSGLLNNNQASDMANRENNFMSREARLLRNDGGVLTPNDANKLAREAANDASKDASYVGNNTGRTGGFFGNLLGLSPTTTLNGALPYNSNPYVTNGFAPYNGIYNNSLLSSPLATPMPVVMPVSVPVTTPVTVPVSAVGTTNPAWARHQAWEQHKRWEERQMNQRFGY